MLGEAATGAAALGVAFTAHALVSEPNGVWKVHSSPAELGLLVTFFAAYTCVCYDGAAKSSELVGALIIFFLGGVLPAAVLVADDHSRPTLEDHGKQRTASWSMATLGRVGLVCSTVIVLAIELAWYETSTSLVADLTGPVAAGVLACIAIALAAYGMPAVLADAEEPKKQVHKSVTIQQASNVYF